MSKHPNKMLIKSTLNDQKGRAECLMQKKFPEMIENVQLGGVNQTNECPPGTNRCVTPCTIKIEE